MSRDSTYYIIVNKQATVNIETRTDAKQNKWLWTLST